jgi:hypothetical protein
VTLILEVWWIALLVADTVKRTSFFLKVLRDVYELLVKD